MPEKTVEACFCLLLFFVFGCFLFFRVFHRSSSFWADLLGCSTFLGAVVFRFFVCLFFGGEQAIEEKAPVVFSGSKGSVIAMRCTILHDAHINGVW